MSNPKAAEAKPTPARIKVESNDVVESRGIQVQSNDEVQIANAPQIESVVIDNHPAGIRVETFVGIQPNIAWVEKTAEAPAAE